MALLRTEPGNTLTIFIKGGRDVRVLVTGDRNWNDPDIIEKHLKKLPKGSIIIEGGARGADTLAKGAATRLGFKVEEYKADWGRYKKAAGPIRNKQMLEEGKPDKGLAFHDNIEHSKGTKNMIAQLEKAGVPVELISHDRITRSKKRSA